MVTAGNEYCFTHFLPTFILIVLFFMPIKLNHLTLFLVGVSTAVSAALREGLGIRYKRHVLLGYP